MPPFVPRKRDASLGPATPPAKRPATAKRAAKGAKPTLFDTLDAPKPSTTTPEEAKAFLNSLEGNDDSSLSEADSDDFEDVPPAKKRKTNIDASAHTQDGEGHSTDEEMDWEDAIDTTQAAPGIADHEIEDLSIALQDDGSGAVMAFQEKKEREKKGPTKRERMVRVMSHCLHVQALMWHNAVRNSWLNDKELQKILVDGLSEGVKKEVRRWKEDMGMKVEEPEDGKGGKARKSAKGKKAAKGKGKEKDKRDGRDWGIDADRLEEGAVNMSRGDPLLRLLKILTAYWRKRFIITAPGLRKQGYMPLRRLADSIKAWEKDKHNHDHGERIENVEALRKQASKMEGSRDLGAQLFTALMRGLGIEARMVATLQPVGFGWSKAEEAAPRKNKNPSVKEVDAEVVAVSEGEREVAESASKLKKKTAPTKTSKAEKPTRRSSRGATNDPINLDDDDDESALSSVPSDDESVIEITPSNTAKNGKKYDRDLAFPHYWAEVLSPVSNTYIPVDPIKLSTVASTQDLLSTFEPRGKLADQAKQVICYTIAHSHDGTAKDVTVRYLKRHQLPGRTKGYRLPIERIPIHNKRGKVVKHEDYDWFKTVMSGYERPFKKRTAADDLEESTDLKPFKPANEKPRPESESLQWYKQSAEYVLERHLRREEAILPTAKPVKTFTTGKGDKAKAEPVFYRKDVVECKSAETWRKEGRDIRVGAQPLKMVPVRAVTLNRKREMEEAERDTGEKLKQGLYSREQTDWIIPPPIVDGVIPKNGYGNMDLFVPTMCPAGAVHIPLRGTKAICRKLEIDFAEAVTGFEFGKQRAVPVIMGVVVAEENEEAVMEAWREIEEERRRKEDVKRQAGAISMWRKFVMGLRIVERMRTEYAKGEGKGEEINPFVNRKRDVKVDEMDVDGVEREDLREQDEVMEGGGFFLPGHEEEEVPNRRQDDEVSERGGGFLLEEDAEDKPASKIHDAAAQSAPITPMSLQSLHRKAAKTDDASDPEDSAVSEPEPDVQPSRPQQRATRKKSLAAPQPRQTNKAAASKPARPKQPARRRSKKQAAPSSEEETASDPSSESSELSDLSSAAEGEDEAPQVRSSPQIVVTPRVRKDWLGVATETRKRRKVTPVRSPYFTHTEEEEDGEEDVESESEEEVVKPRGTTARTRGRK